jgi:hypothetical protein
VAEQIFVWVDYEDAMCDQLLCTHNTYLILPDTDQRITASMLMARSYPLPSLLQHVALQIFPDDCIDLQSLTSLLRTTCFFGANLLALHF